MASAITQQSHVLPGAPAGPREIRFMRPALPALGAVLQTYQPVFHQRLITNGKVVQQLERAAAERLNVNEVVALSSCTSGLMLVLRCLGIQGEVILPSFTFFATGHALLWNGLIPVFADCSPDSWNISPEDVERRITNRTGAILAVHLYGNSCDTSALTRIASEHGIPLIFDAAHAFGASHDGRPIGSFGDAEVFSLSPTKLLVAGEGGLVATNDAGLARKLRAARNYGDAGDYDCEVLGLNARMTEFNAALALSGLSGVDRRIERHQEIAQAYTQGLRDLPGLRFQTVRPGDVHTYKDYSIHIDPALFGLCRDSLAALLQASGVPTKRYFYPPLHRQKLYSNFPWSNLEHTDLLSSGILSLPVYESLTGGEIQRIVSLIRAAHFDRFAAAAR